VTQALVETLDGLAAREGVERSAIALAFLLAHPSAPVCIVDTQTPDRIRASLAALEVHLDRNDVYNLIEAAEGMPLQ
jgi:predicted oxidoreductase